MLLKPLLSLYLTLNKAVSIYMSRVPNFNNLEPSAGDHVLPVRVSPLKSAQHGRHDNVGACGLPVSTSLRDHVVVYENLAISWLHGQRNV